ncbi:MAG: TonB-dependent receptor, partial [Rubrivivax sp.]
GGPMGRQFPLDMDLIERIEFIPGPGGAVYGQNAMFGVVNVVTRDGAGLGGAELAAAYRHPQVMREGRATWGRKFDNGLDVLVSASGMRSRGEDRFMTFGATGVSGVAAGLDGERSRQFFGRIAGGAWSFEHAYGKRRKDDPTGAFLSDPLVSGQFQGDLYAVTQLQFQDRFAGDTLDVSARLFAGEQRYTSHLVFGTAYSFPMSADWRGVELRLLSTAAVAHKLMFGVEAQQNTRIDQAMQNLADPAADRLIRSPRHRVGVYAQDEWRLDPALLATLGLRIDRNDTAGSRFSPRAALIWQATPATSFKALFGRAHREPNAYERDYEDGVSQIANPALKGESIDTLELVADHRVAPDLSLRGSVYQWVMRNLVTLGVEPGQRPHAIPVGREGQRARPGAFGRQVLRRRVRLARQRVDAGRDPSWRARLLNSPRPLGKVNVSALLPWAGLARRLRTALRQPPPDAGRQRARRLCAFAPATEHLGAGPRLGGGAGHPQPLDKRYAHPARTPTGRTPSSRTAAACACSSAGASDGHGVESIPVRAPRAPALLPALLMALLLVFSGAYPITLPQLLRLPLEQLLRLEISAPARGIGAAAASAPAPSARSVR